MTIPERFLLTAFIALLNVPCSARSDLLDSAFDLASNGHVNFDFVKQSETILLGVIAREPSNCRALWTLSRTCDYLGDHATDNAGRRGYYESGVRYAKKALAIDSLSLWAHYWYAINLGSIGQCKGILNTLETVPELKRECALMEKLDTCNGRVLELSGMLFGDLPSLAGGDRDRAVEYLRHAIACDPNYTASYIDLARILVKKGEFEEARALVNAMNGVKKPTDVSENVIYDRPAALKILKDIEGK